jgi:hypothetical protein
MSADAEPFYQAVQLKEERVACRTGSKDEKSTSHAASTISRDDGKNLLEVWSSMHVTCLLNLNVLNFLLAMRMHADVEVR